MEQDQLLESLVQKGETRILFFILDGIGGMYPSELMRAKKPNLDALAERSLCGVMDPVLPGITPGSGPGHLALFGYDPLKYDFGRGVLSALGVGFDLKPDDLAARMNYATLDDNGNVLDRRAYRPSTEENRRLTEMLNSNIKLRQGYELFLVTEAEHRVALIIRGPGLDYRLNDTDPQRTGVPPLPLKPGSPGSELAAELVNDFLDQAHKLLKNEPRINGILLRGFAKRPDIPSLAERFKLRPLAIAQYPMYRGISRLLGMELSEPYQGLAQGLRILKDNWDSHDYFFFHIKKTDSYGEDGNFDAKVSMIEEVDSYIPALLELKPDVLVITGDHSTPSQLRSHSWHPVPVLLHSKWARVDGVKRFDELSCLAGGIGRMSMRHLMSLALAHALRLKKFGA